MSHDDKLDARNRAWIAWGYMIMAAVAHRRHRKLIEQIESEPRDLMQEAAERSQLRRLTRWTKGYYGENPVTVGTAGAIFALFTLGGFRFWRRKRRTK